MKTNLKLFLATCFVSLLAACGNNSSNTNNDASAVNEAAALPAGSPLGSVPSTNAQKADAYTPLVNTQQADSAVKARDLSVAPTAAQITLGAPATSQAAAITKQAASSSGGKPFRIGFYRDVAQTGTASATKQVLTWQATASGGQVAAINFSSSGAKALRIGLLVSQLPASATLRFYAKAADTAYEVNGAEVLRVLATNLASGDKSDAGRTYWGPVVDGTDATFEIELPAGVRADEVDVSVPKISHHFLSLSEASTITPQESGSAPNAGLVCQVDVSCTTPLPAASNAVVWLAYNDFDGASACSGTLLNNSKNNGFPYVLTANHCISDQTVANTVDSRSRYRSTGCNATSFNYFRTPVGGATLVYTAYSTDTTLLLLKGSPPAGVLFAGWDATTVPALSTAVSNIHHPRQDSQRISRGTVTGYLDRNFNAVLDASTATVLDVSLTTGLTQDGSSGSGLFKGSDANPQLIGQLFGGEAPSCSNTSSRSVYGRFDIAFRDGMRTWLSPDSASLNPSRQPVFRFYIPKSGMYFYTIYTSERDTILATLSNAFTYEGIAFYASPTPSAGYAPITRFRNNLNGSYLYTISDVEKASILQNYPQYVLEGTAWYAESSAAGGGSPLYRFRTNNNSHIYTAYDTEKANILANYTSFVLEGPAYYVKLTP